MGTVELLSINSIMNNRNKNLVNFYMPYNEYTNSERKIEINESTSINNFRYNVELVIYNIN